MIELPMKFVDGACGRIVPIHKLRVVQSPNGLFTAVANMADSVGTGLLLGKLLFQVIKPLKSLERLIDVGPLANHEGARRCCGGGGLNGACANTYFKHWQWSYTWPWDLNQPGVQILPETLESPLSTRLHPIGNTPPSVGENQT